MEHNCNGSELFKLFDELIISNELRGMLGIIMKIVQGGVRGGEGGNKCREEFMREVHVRNTKIQKENQSKIQEVADIGSQQKEGGFMWIIDGYQTENDNSL